MHTTQQSTTELDKREPTLPAPARGIAPNPLAERLGTIFLEQQGVGRFDEIVQTLDFPLDFQI
jgi:hypothetical protein